MLNTKPLKKFQEKPQNYGDGEGSLNEKNVFEKYIIMLKIYQQNLRMI